MSDLSRTVPTEDSAFDSVVNSSFNAMDMKAWEHCENCNVRFKTRF